jgi:hypothetical protein
VTWTPPTTNTAEIPAADPLAPRIRDLGGYRLYWSPTTPVTPANRRLIVDEGDLPVSFQQPYRDTPLVACQERHYVITAVDACGVESEPSAISLGKVADAGVNPRPPTGVQAQYAATRHAIVRWRRISTDVADKEIRIERYEVFRSEPVSGGLPAESATWSGDSLAVTDETYYEDRAVPVLATGEVVYYRVRGGDDCGNNSDYSAPAKLECAFTGEVRFVTPQDGDEVRGLVSTTVRVVGGSDVYSGLVIQYGQGPGAVTHSFPTAGPTWTDDTWVASPPGDYTITATVTNLAGCSQSASINVRARRAAALH